MSRISSLHLHNKEVGLYSRLFQSAFHYQFHYSAKLLEEIRMSNNFDRNSLLQFIEGLRSVLFLPKPQKFEMIAFQRCCHLLYAHFQFPHTFLKIMNKLYLRNQIQAQKKLYFWWIPICYNTRFRCGKNMAEKMWRKVEAIYNK